MKGGGGIRKQPTKVIGPPSLSVTEQRACLCFTILPPSSAGL